MGTPEWRRILTHNRDTDENQGILRRLYYDVLKVPIQYYVERRKWLQKTLQVKPSSVNGTFSDGTKHSRMVHFSDVPFLFMVRMSIMSVGSSVQSVYSLLR